MKTLLPDLWTRDFMTDPFKAFERDLYGRDFLRDFAKIYDAPMRQGMTPVPAMNIAETEKTIEATLELQVALGNLGCEP